MIVKTMDIFPEINGSNLEGEKIILPYGLFKDLNIVILAFKRHQQSLVDSWIPELTKIRNKYLNFDFYEIPTLAKGYLPMRFIIDGGMRAGIPNIDTRKRTITIYTNKGKIKEKLGINHEDTIYLFLITKQGQILWKESGEFQEKKIAKLREIITKNSS